MKLGRKKRFLSSAISAVLAATSILSTVPNYVSADTASDGVEIVTDEAEKVKLLIGNNKPEIQGSTVKDTLKKAKDKYLLGIASQFGVFLENDFIGYSADVESRLAVGGGANLADDLNGQNGYEVGNGEFGDQYVDPKPEVPVPKISLDFLLNNAEYAHAIVGKGPFQNIITQSHDEYQTESSVKDEGAKKKLDKIFVIGNDVDLTDSSTNHKYDGSSYQNDAGSFRKTNEELINFTETFTDFRKTAKILSEQKTEGAELIFSNNTVSIDPEKYTSTDKENLSGGTSEEWNGNKNNIAHFRYNGDDSVDVVKFNISSEDWAAISTKCLFISYENIPENANVIVNVSGQEIVLTDTYTITFWNGTQITPAGNQGVDGVDFKAISNNDPHCERLLYNFHEASSLKVDKKLLW